MDKTAQEETEDWRRQQAVNPCNAAAGLQGSGLNPVPRGLNFSLLQPRQRELGMWASLRSPPFMKAIHTVMASVLLNQPKLLQSTSGWLKVTQHPVQLEIVGGSEWWLLPLSKFTCCLSVTTNEQACPFSWILISSEGLHSPLQLT